MERYHINNIDENTLYSTQMIKTNWEFNDWSKEVLRRLSNEVYGAKPDYSPLYERWMEKYGKQDGLRATPILDEVHVRGKFTMMTKPEIKKVIFNDPATIVFWNDGTKTMVRAQEGEVFDPEKGLAMAISKKALGNKGNYFEEFKKWILEEKKEEEKLPDAVTDSFTALREAGAEIAKGIEDAMKAYKKTVGEMW